MLAESGHLFYPTDFMTRMVPPYLVNRLDSERWGNFLRGISLCSGGSARVKANVNGSSPANVGGGQSLSGVSQTLPITNAFPSIHTYFPTGLRNSTLHVKAGRNNFLWYLLETIFAFKPGFLSQPKADLQLPAVNENTQPALLPGRNVYSTCLAIDLYRTIHLTKCSY